MLERYETLLRVSQTLISSHCSEGLFDILVRELRAVVSFDFLGAGIYVVLNRIDLSEAPPEKSVFAAAEGIRSY